MRRAVVVLGVIATIGTAVWGLFAYAFGSFPGAQFPRLLAFLMMAPLAILPSGALADSHPRAAGFALIAAAVASGISLITVRVGLGVGPVPLRDALLVLAAPCLPLALLGAGLLKWGTKTSPESSGPGPRFGTIYAGVHLAATILILGWAIASTALWAWKLQWTLTVTPNGGAPSAIRLDSRQPQSRLRSRISEALEPVFTDPGRPGPRSLGRFELTGLDGGGKEIRVTYESRLEAERGRVSVTRSDLPKGMDHVRAESFGDAKRMIAQNLEQFVAINKLSPLR
jgi:hypothetical protein